jgi:hypothetical protein
MARSANQPLRRLWLWLVAVLILAGVAGYNLHTSRGPGTSFVEMILGSPPEKEGARERELDRLVIEARARFCAKQEEVQALLDGKSTLRQAVARFRELSTSHLVDGNALSEKQLCEDLLDHAGYLHRHQDDDEIEAELSPLRQDIREHLSRARK